MRGCGNTLCVATTPRLRQFPWLIFQTPNLRRRLGQPVGSARAQRGAEPHSSSRLARSSSSCSTPVRVSLRPCGGVDHVSHWRASVSSVSSTVDACATISYNTAAGEKPRAGQGEVVGSPPPCSYY